MRIGEYEIVIRKYPALASIPTWKLVEFYSGATGTYARLKKETDPENWDCRIETTEIYWEGLPNLTNPGRIPNIGDLVQFNGNTQPRSLPEDEQRIVLKKLGLL